MSAPALIFATVDAATGKPGPEPNVTFPQGTTGPLVLSRELERKLGSGSSSKLKKLSAMSSQSRSGLNSNQGSVILKQTYKNISGK